MKCIYLPEADALVWLTDRETLPAEASLHLRGGPEGPLLAEINQLPALLPLRLQQSQQLWLQQSGAAHRLMLQLQTEPVPELRLQNAHTLAWQPTNTWESLWISRWTLNAHRQLQQLSSQQLAVAAGQVTLSAPDSGPGFWLVQPLQAQAGGAQRLGPAWTAFDTGDGAICTGPLAPWLQRQCPDAEPARQLDLLAVHWPELAAALAALPFSAPERLCLLAWPLPLVLALVQLWQRCREQAELQATALSLCARPESLWWLAQTPAARTLLQSGQSLERWLAAGAPPLTLAWLVQCLAPHWQALLPPGPLPLSEQHFWFKALQQQADASPETLAALRFCELERHWSVSPAEALELHNSWQGLNPEMLAGLTALLCPSHALHTEGQALYTRRQNLQHKPELHSLGVRAQNWLKALVAAARDARLDLPESPNLTQFWHSLKTATLAACAQHSDLGPWPDCLQQLDAADQAFWLACLQQRQAEREQAQQRQILQTLQQEYSHWPDAKLQQALQTWSKAVDLPELLQLLDLQTAHTAAEQALQQQLQNGQTRLDSLQALSADPAWQQLRQQLQNWQSLTAWLALCHLQEPLVASAAARQTAWQDELNALTPYARWLGIAPLTLPPVAALAPVQLALELVYTQTALQAQTDRLTARHQLSAADLAALYALARRSTPPLDLPLLLARREALQHHLQTLQQTFQSPLQPSLPSLLAHPAAPLWLARLQAQNTNYWRAEQQALYHTALSWLQVADPLVLLQNFEALEAVWAALQQELALLTPAYCQQMHLELLAFLMRAAQGIWRSSHREADGLRQRPAYPADLQALLDALTRAEPDSALLRAAHDYGLQPILSPAEKTL